METDRHRSRRAPCYVNARRRGYVERRRVALAIAAFDPRTALIIELASGERHAIDITSQKTIALD